MVSNVAAMASNARSTDSSVADTDSNAADTDNNARNVAAMVSPIVVSKADTIPMRSIR